MKNKIIQAFTPIKSTKVKKGTKIVPKDIIITKYEEKTTYNEEGDRITKRIPVKVNITKKVNATAKLIKEKTAQEKLAELEKIFSTK